MSAGVAMATAARVHMVVTDAVAEVIEATDDLDIAWIPPTLIDEADGPYR